MLYCCATDHCFQNLYHSWFDIKKVFHARKITQNCQRNYLPWWHNNLISSISCIACWQKYVTCWYTYLACLHKFFFTIVTCGHNIHCLNCILFFSHFHLTCLHNLYQYNFGTSILPCMYGQKCATILLYLYMVKNLIYIVYLGIYEYYHQLWMNCQWKDCN